MVRRPTQAQERELRALEIAEELFGLPPDTRGARLEESCLHDQKLRARVEALLTAESAGDFPLPVDFPHPEGFRTPSTIEPGATIGAYRIRRRIASGGMGTVYEAVQDQPRRTVALKTLRFELASPESRNRFRNEAEFLAALSHPGIAQVFEAGVHTERTSLGVHSTPFFAMEFIDGARDLSSYVREEQLGRDDLLKLLITLCEAVEHAHARGIVHRDLKPGNVLLDREGRARIIDFGIARVVNRDLGLSTVETRPGGMTGTLRYMSPEQVEGRQADIGAATDVYALGVMLYELLCGAHPLEVPSETTNDWSQAILEQPPVPPRRRMPDLDPELEIILLTALAKQPGQRYSSAAAFAGDLARVQANLPILARRPSLGRRLALFTARRRALVGAAAVVLAIGAVAFAFQRDSETRALESEAVAERRTEDVREVARGLLVGVHDSLDGLPGATAARASVVRSTLATLDRLSDDAGDDQLFRRELAEGYARLGRIQAYPSNSNLGETEAGLAAYRKSLQLLSGLAVDDSQRVRRAELLRETAAVLRQMGRMSDALIEQERALELARGFDDRPQLLVATVAQTGDSLLELGRAEEARVMYEEALVIAQEHSLHRDVQVLCNKLGDIALASHDLEKAEQLYSKAFEIADKIAEQRAGDVRFDRDIGASLGRLGNLALASRNPAKALEHFERALTRAHARFVADEADAQASLDLALCFTWIGAAQAALGRGADALSAREEACRRYAEITAKPDCSTESILHHGVALISLAETYRALRQPVQALETISEAVAVLAQVMASDAAAAEPRRRFLIALDLEAGLLCDAGEFEPALEATERYHSQAVSALELDPSNLGFLQQRMIAEDRLGLVHQALGRERSLSTERRIEHTYSAIQWYEATLMSSDELHERGLIGPGDEETRRAIESEFGVLAAELEALGE